jgi:hypothetical protein
MKKSSTRPDQRSLENPKDENFIKIILVCKFSYFSESRHFFYSSKHGEHRRVSIDLLYIRRRSILKASLSSIYTAMCTVKESPSYSDLFVYAFGLRLISWKRSRYRRKSSTDISISTRVCMARKSGKYVRRQKSAKVLRISWL